MNLRLGCFIIVCLILSSSAWSSQGKGGFGEWKDTPGWEIVNNPSGTYSLRADSPGDSSAWKTDFSLGEKWTYEVDAAVMANRGAPGNGSAIALALGTKDGVKLLANIEHGDNGMSLISVQYFDNNQWHNVLQPNWITGGDSFYHVKLERKDGSKTLHITVSGNKGLSYSGETSEIGADFLSKANVPGLRSCGALVDFTNLRIESDGRVVQTGIRLK
jgi:hypothetical protein